MRAYSAAHFPFDEHLILRWQDATAGVVSEYTGGADGRAYPITLHGEIRGPAASIADAEQRFPSTIGSVLPILALAGNAAIADPLPITTHGLDVSTPQPIIYYQTPPADAWFPPGKRLFDVDATRALLASMTKHAVGGLLFRAVEAYRRALGHWVPEEQLLAGEFLYISAETLSRFLVDSRAADRGISHKNLARLLDEPDAEALRRRYLREEIFGGDTEALENLSKASNGFEHGYMAFNEIRGLMDAILQRSMGHTRRALLAAAGVPASGQARLLAEAFEEPRALVPAVKVVRGELSLRDPEGAAPAMDGGSVELEIPPTRITGGQRDASGEIRFQVPTDVKVVQLPENVQITFTSAGMRAAHVTRASASPAEAVSNPRDESGVGESER